MQASLFRGDLHDVLERYRLCSSHYEADVVVRLTGDCPFIDPFSLTRSSMLF